MSKLSWLGGRDAAPALRFSTARPGANALSYGELRERVARVELPASGVVRAQSHDVEELLITVLAALRSERPVLVAEPGNTVVGELGPISAEVGLILMTSGSSGRSRAVARTSLSWHSSFAPFSDATGITQHDTVALTGSLHVSMHLFAALHALWMGAELTTSPASASAVHCTPTVLGRLLSAQTLPRRVIVAGAALPTSIRDAVRARGSLLTEYYGAAELSFVGISDSNGTLRAFPGVDIELRADRNNAHDDAHDDAHLNARDNERDSEHGDASPATLWARSPYLALGYVSSAASTAGTADTTRRAHTPGALQRDDAGFASVGDYAQIEADGALRVLGRSDSAVTTAGATVLSEDIERVLETIPGVTAAAVLGQPHAVLGEIVVAVIETPHTHAVPDDAQVDASSEAITLASVRAASNALLAAAERPRRWLLVDELPRTASGKLAKGTLRAAMQNGTIAVHELGDTPDV